MYSDAARRSGVNLNVLVDLDLGDHRTGVSAGKPALDLARGCRRASPELPGSAGVFRARLPHECGRRYGRLLSRRAAAGRGNEATAREQRNPAPVVTGGSTGTERAHPRAIVHDRVASWLLRTDGRRFPRPHWNPKFAHALTVLATVVSANHPDRVTVDAGFKAFATDRAFGPDGAHRARTPATSGRAMNSDTCSVEDAQARPRLGGHLRFIPPHCDPTVNLYDRIYLCSGDIVLETWSTVMGIDTMPTEIFSFRRPHRGSEAHRNQYDRARCTAHEHRGVTSSQLMRGEPDFPTPRISCRLPSPL